MPMWNTPASSSLARPYPTDSSAAVSPMVQGDSRALSLQFFLTAPYYTLLTISLCVDIN